MAYLDQPSPEVWSERQAWFEGQLLEHEQRGSFLVSEQACALIGEAQACFCAGAWISVIVFAFTVIDAQLRETEAPGFKGNSKRLLEDLGLDARFQELRTRRNRIVHIDPEAPAITVDQQWADRFELESEACEAVELMLEAFFASPCV
jgi:hypothetical protein